MPRQTEVSRAMSHALRHEPATYGLTLDRQGWVPLADLLAALRRQWPSLTEDDVRAVVRDAAKQRHEIDGDRVRAVYGHSVEGRVTHEPAAPPPMLFHGTAPETVETILAEGLRPMARQYVHLSTDPETAVSVGSRKDRAPVILVIDAAAATAAGVEFYAVERGIMLADAVPAEFIRCQASSEASDPGSL